MEVETSLLTVSSVAEAAVVGVPDDLHGNVIWAFVVQTEEEALEPLQIIRECQQIMESAAVPKQVISVKALPKNSNGKIDKNELKRIANEQHKNLVTSHA